MSESQLMAERRVRLSPQAQVDLSALERAVAADQKATKVEAELAAHERICSERYRNLDANVAELKSNIRELNNDAKHAIDDLANRQEGYHRTNTDATNKLISEVAQISQRVAVGQGKSDGERGVTNFILRNLPTLFTGALFFLTIWWHQK